MTEANTDTWFSEDVATFGDRLEAARTAAGLSQQDLARKLGVRDTTVKAWEADMGEPRANRLQMLAGMLNVSLRWLLTGEGAGIDAPGSDASTDAPLPLNAQLALADMARLRAQMITLSQDIARLERSFRAQLRNVA